MLVLFSGIQIELISGALIMSSPGMRVREQISVLCPASQLGDVFMQFCITNHDAAVQRHYWQCPVAVPDSANDISSQLVGAQNGNISFLSPL